MLFTLTAFWCFCLLQSDIFDDIMSFILLVRVRENVKLSVKKSNIYFPSIYEMWAENDQFIRKR